MHPFHYRLHGLRIGSDRSLPELARCAPGAIDLAIETASAPTGQGYALPIDDVALFEIEDGTTIRVIPVPGVDERNVRLFLLGSAIGVALHQRGLLPLHANAMVRDGKAIAFTGPSGSGKSSLAMWCHDEGFDLLADDVCVIQPGAERPMVAPGLARVRLWRDALERSGRTADGHPLSFSGSRDDREKYDVLLPDRPALAPAPLVSVGVLEFGDRLDIVALQGREKVEALIANTYRGHLVEAIGDPVTFFQTCVDVARTIAVYRVVRPRDDRQFVADARSIVEALFAA